MQYHSHRQERRSAPGGDLDPGHSAHANQQLYVGSELYRRSQQQSDRCSRYQCDQSARSPGEIAFLPWGSREPSESRELQTDRPFYQQFPYLQFINWLSNIDRSSYNALQTTFTARAYHGLGFVAAYTYSHSLDDYSTARGIHVPQNNLNPDADYGNSDFDQRHHFSFSVNYALPGKKGYGQMLEGWSR